MESKPKVRYDPSPEKESLPKNKVRLLKNIIFYKKYIDSNTKKNKR